MNPSITSYESLSRPASTVSITESENRSTSSTTDHDKEYLAVEKKSTDRITNDTQPTMRSAENNHVSLISLDNPAKASLAETLKRNLSEDRLLEFETTIRNLDQDTLLRALDDLPDWMIEKYLAIRGLEPGKNSEQNRANLILFFLQSIQIPIFKKLRSLYLRMFIMLNSRIY